MKLLTKEIIGKLPPLYSQENVKDPKCEVKFFCPWNNWTWYVIEGEEQEFELENGEIKKTYLFFGYVVGEFPELGYFTLHELEKVHGRGGLKIERDMHWTPRNLSEIKNKIETERGYC